MRLAWSLGQKNERRAPLRDGDNRHGDRNGEARPLPRWHPLSTGGAAPVLVWLRLVPLRTQSRGVARARTIPRRVLDVGVEERERAGADARDGLRANERVAERRSRCPEVS